MEDKFVPFRIFYNKRGEEGGYAFGDPYTLVEYSEDQELIFYGFGTDGKGVVSFNQFIGDSSQGFVVGAHLGKEYNVDTLTSDENNDSMIDAMSTRLSANARKSFRRKAFEAYLYRYRFAKALEYAPRDDVEFRKTHEDTMLELQRLANDEVLKPNFTTVVYYMTEWLLDKFVRN